jgi:hypothetical protein
MRKQVVGSVRILVTAMLVAAVLAVVFEALGLNLMSLAE